MCTRKRKQQQQKAPDPKLPFFRMEGLGLESHKLGLCKAPLHPCFLESAERKWQTSQDIWLRFVKNTHLGLGGFLRGGSERHGLSKKIAHGQFQKLWLSPLSRTSLAVVTGSKVEQCLQITWGRGQDVQLIEKVEGGKTSSVSVSREIP